VGLAVTLLLLVSLVVTASRGAIGVGLVLLLVLAAAWWPRWRAAAPATLVAVAVVAASLLIGKAEVVVKQEMVAAQGDVLSNRGGVWHTGLAALERYPWFGVGMGNYQFITPERIRAWRAESGRDFDPAQYGNWGHGHSVFLNTLAERGLVGFAVFGAVALAWLVWLVRYRPRRTDDDLQWTLWGGALSAWFVSLGVGLVNTTLHSEHAILSVLLLGLWLSRTGKARAS
jgi:O-antigen ligase